MTNNDKIKQLEARVEALKTGLQFYANPENWKEIETGIGMCPSEADMDCGGTARDLLALPDPS